MNDTGEDFITDAEDGELTEPEDENVNAGGDEWSSCERFIFKETHLKGFVLKKINV